MSDSWHAPGAGKGGFFESATLRERARAGRDAFVRDFPVPALQVIAQGAAPAEEEAGQLGTGVQLLTVAIAGGATLRYMGKIAFVAKRPGNAYAHLISIGRSEKNDISIAVDSISKVHGYFVRDENDGWAFNDHGSTNGSFLDEEPLTSGQKTPLRSGSLLRLGLEISLEFLDPAALYERLVG